MTKKKNNNNNNEQACSCKQHMVNSFLIISQFLVTGFKLHVTLVSRDTASQEISPLLQPMTYPQSSVAQLTKMASSREIEGHRPTRRTNCSIGDFGTL